jgi:D-aminoacyl-tRNA deacylase
MDTFYILCRPDPASSNIGASLIEEGQFGPEARADGMELFRSGADCLVTIDTIHIHREGLDSQIGEVFGISPGRLVFMSTHRSRSNTPAITFHPIGNYGEALLGGRPGTLVPSCPELMTGTMLAMNRTGHAGYQITYEATHHGPHIETPALFAEIGSGEEQWRDADAGREVARALLLKEEPEGINAVGVGGGHYCSRFVEIARKRKVNFGHFIPNHNLHLLDEKVAQELAEKSPRTSHFVVHEDRKHTESIERVGQLLEAAGLKKLDHSLSPFRK